MTNLTKEDLSLIEQMDIRLKRLELMPHNSWKPNQCAKNCGGKNCEKKCIYSVFWGTSEPIVEPKEDVKYIYRKAIKHYINYKKDVIYKFEEKKLSDVYPFTIPSNEKSYLAQQKEVEWKPEVGSWVWNNPNKTLLGLVKEFSDHKNKVYVDFQDGRFEWWHTNILCKPTPEEISNHLKAILIKKIQNNDNNIDIQFNTENKSISCVYNVK